MPNIPENHNHKIIETDESVFIEKYHDEQYRLINPDGTFNIDRKGRSGANMYETIVSMTWTKILLSFLFIYFIINCLFALLFMVIGVDHVQGIQGDTWLENYTQMIFFSIQTFTTVGYGNLSPEGNAASLLAALVAFVGLISFAILTGLSFAKFSKPTAHILFSDKMLIAPNENKDNNPSLQFRVVNATKNQIIDLEVRVTLAWLEEVGGVMRRRFKRLDLELENIHLFPLNWTVVHNIDKNSPLNGLGLQVLMEKQMEILILIKGFNDTYSQMVHSKRSYSCAEMIDGARFLPMYENTKSKTILHLSRLNDREAYIFKVQP